MNINKLFSEISISVFVFPLLISLFVLIFLKIKKSTMWSSSLMSDSKIKHIRIPQGFFESKLPLISGDGFDILSNSKFIQFKKSVKVRTTTIFFDLFVSLLIVISFVLVIFFGKEENTNYTVVYFTSISIFFYLMLVFYKCVLLLIFCNKNKTKISWSIFVSMFSLGTFSLILAVIFGFKNIFAERDNFIFQNSFSINNKQKKFIHHDLFKNLSNNSSEPELWTYQFDSTYTFASNPKNNKFSIIWVLMRFILLPLFALNLIIFILKKYFLFRVRSFNWMKALGDKNSYNNLKMIEALEKYDNPYNKNFSSKLFTLEAIYRNFENWRILF